MGVEQWVVVSQYRQNRHPQYMLSPRDCQGHEILSRSLQIPPTRSSKECPNPCSTGGDCLWPWVTGKNRLVSGAGTHFQHLQKSSSITLPQAADQLWIVTDASVKAVGLAATLYVMRHGKLHLSGHFSAWLRSHQRTWLPCELEALAIAASVKHFSPYIIQSHKPVCVLTDSKPCVEAAEKLCRGEFSASPRVATFL